MIKPLFATPCYNGLATWQYTNSMINLAESLRGFDIPFKTYMVGGDSIVDRARNDCVAEFLDSNCTHLFFIDSDIAFKPQDAMDMLSSGLDFVLAPYRKKTIDEEWTVSLIDSDYQLGTTLLKYHPKSQSIRYITCAEGGAGFLCLSRKSILELTKDVPTYKWLRNNITRRCPNLFKTIIDNDIRIGEDQYICRRWRSFGEIVWCSVDTQIAHIGNGIQFEGNYARFIQLKDNVNNKTPKLQSS